MIWNQSVISKTGGRGENQDFCGYVQSALTGIWVVADGLGGHLGGEVASCSAVQAILDGYQLHSEATEENVFALTNTANNHILIGQKEDLHCENMQTTIVFCLTDGKTAFLANVGDSRGYYFSNYELVLQTKDHSFPQLLVDQGEISEKDIRFHEDRNKVLRSLGKSETVKPNIQRIEGPIQMGDAFLLCSDGFWELVTEEEMIIDLAKSNTPKEWLHNMEIRLIHRMKAHHDNYSAIAIFYG